MLKRENYVVRITHVQMDGDDGIWVRFSDGTFAGYVIEELLELRPVREESVDSSE